MIPFSYVLLLLNFGVHALAFEIEANCLNGPKKLTGQTLILASVHCTHCTDFIRKDNSKMASQNKELATLIFKESNWREIRKYLAKKKLLNQSCLLNRHLEQKFSGNITPQKVQLQIQ